MPFVHLQLTLTDSLDFGAQSGSVTQNLDLFLIPAAPGSCTVTSITLSTGFTTTMTFPQVITPGSHLIVPIVKAGVVATAGTATVNVTFSDSIVGNPTVVLNSTTQPTSFGLSLLQSAYNLGQIDLSALPSGSISQSFTVTNNNSSPHDARVTALSVNPNWTSNGLSPGTIVHAAGQTLSIQLSTSNLFVGQQDGSGTPGICQIFQITFEDVSNTSNTITLTGYLLYYAIPMVSAFTLTGSVLQFLTTWGTTLKQMDGTNLNCEEPASFQRQFDFDLPGFEKGVFRFYTRVENLGAVQLQVNETSSNGDNVTQTQNLGVDQVFKVGVGNLQGFLWDLIANGEIVTVTVTRPSSAGSLSLTLYGFHFEERGGIYEGA